MSGKKRYDAAIVGSGPSGQTAAIELAAAGLRVALTERVGAFGGSSLHVGTIPSKTLRETVLSLTGYRLHPAHRARLGASRGEITYAELKATIDWAIRNETQFLARRMERAGVDLYFGAASFKNERELVVAGENENTITAEKIIIASGSKAARPGGLPFDGRTVIDSDEIFADPAKSFIPRDMIILGGGVIAMEYAAIFALLGVKVYVLSRASSVLSFVDGDLLQVVLDSVKELGAEIRVGAQLEKAVRRDDGKVETKLAGGETIAADMFVAAAGRVGNAEDLKIENAGLSLNERGLIKTDERYETSVSGVYAVGDVIGYPSLAASSKQQGREVARRMLGLPVKPYDPALLPVGIYTIPEISYVGQSEAELTERKTDYVKGEARYEEIAKNSVAGGRGGLIKLLFGADGGRLFGAGAAGESASEIIHAAQAVIASGGTVDYFEETVFNYPTFSDGLKIAAFDAVKKMKRPAALI